MGGSPGAPPALPGAAAGGSARAGRSPARALRLGTYGVAVHLVAAVAWISPESVCRVQAALMGDPSFHETYRGLVWGHLVEERSAPAGSIVFLGDSLLERMDPRVMTPGPVLNFGVGGDTTVGLARRLLRYRRLKDSRALVLSVGVNDLAHAGVDAIAGRYRAILGELPAGVPVIVGAVLPINASMYRQANITYVNGRRVDNARIRALNARIRALARELPRAVFVDATPAMVDGTGNLDARFTVDGVHLSDEGYRAWATVLRPALAGLPDATAQAAGGQR